MACHPEGDRNLALSSRDAGLLYENYCDKRAPKKIRKL